MFNLPFEANVLRQSKIFHLNGIDCKIRIYFSPSEEQWYLDLDAPVERRVLSGRRITNDQSVMQDIFTPLNGDIICRRLQRIPLITDNPKQGAWGITHRLMFVSRD